MRGYFSSLVCSRVSVDVGVVYSVPVVCKTTFFARPLESLRCRALRSLSECFHYIWDIYALNQRPGCEDELDEGFVHMVLAILCKMPS